MLPHNNNLTESGYIGEELAEGLSDLDRKCLVINQVLKDGDFGFEEALKLYKVSKEEYEKFLANRAITEIQKSISSIKDPQVEAILAFQILSYITQSSLALMLINDAVTIKYTADIVKFFKDLLENIKSEKVKVKA